MCNALKALSAAALMAVASGCTLLGGPDRSQPAALDETSAATLYEAQRTLDYLALLNEVRRADPTRQADIVEQARQASETSPTFTHRLRYALLLAMPGHGASDPDTARSALTALLAAPEGLLPAEVALAQVMLQDVEARLAMRDENQALAATAREGKEQSQAMNRRLQAQVAENARLKQELDEALAKLEAVADLERSLVERQAVPKGPQP